MKNLQTNLAIMVNLITLLINLHLHPVNNKEQSVLDYEKFTKMLEHYYASQKTAPGEPLKITRKPCFRNPKAPLTRPVRKRKVARKHSSDLSDCKKN